MYYEITIYYNGEVDADVFNIDKDELMPFINFLTTKINNLHSFTILLKYTYQ